MKIHTNMLEIRRTRQQSQAKLASAARVHPNTVGKLERGEMVPTISLARRVAAALGVTVDEVWPDHGEPCGGEV